jgi:hypothetical protein
MNTSLATPPNALYTPLLVILVHVQPCEDELFAHHLAKHVTTWRCIRRMYQGLLRERVFDAEAEAEDEREDDAKHDTGDDNSEGRWGV